MESNFFGFTRVLIETYWNVKEEAKVVEYIFDKVLIETYWNVKF